MLHRGQQINQRMRLVLWLALFLWGAYLLTYDGILTNTDGKSMVAVTENIVKFGRFDTRQLVNWEDVSLGYRDLPFSKYPLGPSLLMIPFYAFALIVPGIGLLQTTLLLPLLATVATACLLFLISQELDYDASAGLLLALIFAFCTGAWVYMALLMTEALAGFAFAFTFYTLLRYRASPTILWATLGGVGLGILVLIKTINVLVIPIFLWYAFVQGNRQKFRVDWSGLWPCLAPLTVGVALVALYNILRFGNPLISGYDSDELFSTPLWVGGLGLLFSPYKSLFLFNPILLLYPIGFVLGRFLLRREAVLGLLLLALHVVLFGMWWSWEGGKSWGPRFLQPIIPILVIQLLPLIDKLLKRPILWQIIPVVLLAFLSVFIQLLGLTADDPYLAKYDFTAPFADVSNRPWAEVPIVGHLLGWREAPIDFAWVWQRGDLFFMSSPTLIFTLIVLGIGGVGLFFQWRFRTQGGLAQSWLIGAWALSLVVTLLFLQSIKNDPRSIKDFEEAVVLQSDYNTLLSSIDINSDSQDALILTDKRFEPYLLDHYKTRAPWYTLDKAKDVEILTTVPK
ncbi:MAG: hypothetical protein AAF485_32155, partial [Chloroflexota bacterium]